MDIDKLLKAKGGIHLDIGCGANKQPGFVGMDMQELPGVDIVHDLLDFPWPLPDGSVLTAITSHLLEHIPKTQVIYKNKKLRTIHPLMMVMDEIWRVMKVGGTLAIAVPHGESKGFIQDPTHASPLNEITWAYFCPDAFEGLYYSFYQPHPWRIKGDDPQLYYNPVGNMEVVMVKVSEDG